MKGLRLFCSFDSVPIRESPHMTGVKCAAKANGVIYVSREVMDLIRSEKLESPLREIALLDLDILGAMDEDYE